ncbi:hypothetical protein EYB26_000415 [Talaromyces marneffei]|uniref:uncharacterized protein n=1 Tax=Talaromyces marneffei TaxID=37727 RepID=UPI0012A99DCC|nr:uncharacterized protein EYB26_000415 [Talaromyces marneffei]QGA12770.1 hypothetical protein EYB26_000415 [Talaromyces marneffei]
MPTLIQLPRELLILISDLLEQIEPDNVIDLACVNRIFLSICTPLLQVRSLKFFVCDDGEQLADDILHYSQLLQSLSALWAVRRLMIVTNDDENVRLQQRQRQSQQQWRRPRIPPSAYRGYENDYLKSLVGKPGAMKYKDTAHQKNHIWKPLAEFILRLPNLESIFYNSYYQFPPCLLDSLHKHRSQCRLYITRFALWSLEPQGPTDPYEFKLLGSPSLHGIGTVLDGTDRNRTRGSTPSWEHVYLPKALRYLVSGLTQQLKILVVTGLGSSWCYYSPPWTGFTLQDRGLLEHLEIRETKHHQLEQNTKEDIEKWNQATDFSVLKTFKLITYSTLSALEYMTTNCQFRSLTKLTIQFRPDWIRHHPFDYYSAASSFLLNLPRLSSLELHSWHPKMATESILKHHGPRLQKLWLLPCRGETIPLETLHRLSENCTFLEELSTRISRSRGDALEVSKYKAIGALPRLKRLFLKLDASDIFLLDGYDYEDEAEGQEVPETRNDASFNSFDQQYCECRFFHHWLRPRNGHIRDAFINATLDPDLAKSIFQTIRSGNNTDGKNSCPLEFLELRVRGAGQLSWDMRELKWGFHEVLHKLSCARRVTRKKDEDIKIELVDIPEDMFPSEESWDLGLDKGIPNILPFALKIYQRVWPPKNKHWFDDWHSFPLALSAEDEIDWSKE